MPPNFVFWQPTLSAHQASMIRSLAEQATVTLCTEQGVGRNRAAFGWQPDYGSARIHVGTTRETARSLVSRSSRDSVHVVSGLLSYPLIGKVTRWLSQDGRRIFVMSEAPPPGGRIRVLAGRARLRLVGEKNVERYLLIGPRAIESFSAFGADMQKIVPWMYFVEKPTYGASVDARVDFIFVGSLIELKRVDLLLRALAREPSWLCRVVGDGPLKLELNALSSSLGLSDRVDWAGAVTNCVAVAAMWASEVLVLPSDYDGWGAVVNEALLTGAAAVVSTFCGSSSLVGTGLPVWEFSPGDLDGLHRAMRSAREWVSSRDRRAAIRTAERILSGAEGAKFLVELAICSSNSRPPAPRWAQAGEL